MTCGHDLSPQEMQAGQERESRIPTGGGGDERWHFPSNGRRTLS
jgi:hypothetical protein